MPGHRITAADTTGAGDSFIGALLYQLQLIPDALHTIEQSRAEAILRFANAAAALTTTRYGAIPALPTASEVEAFLSLNE
ncbi:aminoimidazole riboside kinase [compost metagenome]